MRTTNVESIDVIQDVPKWMHQSNKWKISTAFNVLISNAQCKILSIWSLKLRKFQNSQVSQKNWKNPHILSIVTSL